jgi:hypothetical protein
MGSGAMSDREAITAVLDRFEAAQAEVAALAFDALTAPEVLTVKDRLETVSRRQAAVDHRLTHQLTSHASPVELGGKSWTDVLSNRLRIGRGEARRRLEEADTLGPRTAMTGEPLQPVLPNVAAAQAAGTIGAEHLRRPAHGRRYRNPSGLRGRPGQDRQRAHPRRVTQGRRPAHGVGAPRRGLQRCRPGPAPRTDHR